MTDTTTYAPHRLTRLGRVYDAALSLVLLVSVWAWMWVPDAIRGHGGPEGPSIFPGVPRPEQFTGVPWTAFALAALCILPLALRRRYPASVLVAVSAATVLFGATASVQARAFQLSPILVGMLVALYTAASLLDRRRLAALAIPCAVAVIAVMAPEWGSTMFWAEVVRNAALFAGAAAIGDAARNRRAYVDEVEQRAAEAERTREEEARRRVDDERLRIARELHDVTAHSLSIVAVQSGVALHVLDTDPEAARTALAAIRDTSRESLQELRGMLGVLRSSGDATAGAPLAPTPGLGRLDDLVRPLRDAGLHVEVAGLPLPGPLPAIVDASAYRIVQEALTNVLRHAGSATVTVDISASDDALRVEISDDGSGSPVRTEAEGHGIAGMRERATALGGTFVAGPRAGGGWRVEAVLPFASRSA